MEVRVDRSMEGGPSERGGPWKRTAGVRTPRLNELFYVLSSCLCQTHKGMNGMGRTVTTHQAVSKASGQSWPLGPLATREKAGAVDWFFKWNQKIRYIFLICGQVLGFYNFLTLVKCRNGWLRKEMEEQITLDMQAAGRNDSWEHRMPSLEISKESDIAANWEWGEKSRLS